MTRFKPTLSVVRLRVERLGLVAYDESLHQGVNIFRGDNSSGKSTILNFLYYGVGGDVTDWSETALLCTRVLVQVLLNGSPATLARDISQKSGQPMDVYAGTMEEALAAPATAWDRYPYRRSESRESFSQVLFRLLEIPEASNEASGNVTVHQILRLMYADQLSPIGTLFKFEQFDPPLLRDTVGRLVFGAYENELYSNELRIRDLEKEHALVSTELSAATRLLTQSGQVLTPGWLDAERKKIQSERAKIDEEIAKAERALFEAGKADNLTLVAQERAYSEVQNVQVEIVQVRERIDTHKFEIADASKYIEDLTRKLVALTDSSATSNAFSSISFQYCPACYAVIEPDHPAHACHLCKSPYDSDRTKTRIVALINDTSNQLRQSRIVQRERIDELSKLETQLQGLTSKWEVSSAKLNSASRTPSSEARQKLRDLQRMAGYAERQLEDLATKDQLSTSLEKLITRKAQLNAEITRLSERNESLKSSLNRRLSVAYAEVEAEILSLLRNDLPREEAFINASSIQFDFSSNKLSVDNQSYFSASSRVILRNSFFVGLFAAATKDPSFRHLRLCILDSIEDKGMQPDRSHNFQRSIVKASEAALCEHQAIFATSMIAPELDIPALTIGHYSTLESHTLAIQTARRASEP